MRRLLLTLLLAPACCLAKPTATAFAETQGVTTQEGQLTDLYSYHKIVIANDLPATANFTWAMTLCPETQPDRCQIVYDHLSLTKGQHFTKTYTLHTQVVFQATGEKPITAQTHISGAADSWGTDTKYAEVFR